MKFTEIKEAGISIADMDDLSELKKQMEQLKNVEVTWADVEAGTATKNDYATWRRRYNKISDAAMKIEIKQMNVKSELERVQSLSKAVDPKVQKLADRFHDLTCTMDHTERCAYHYGNWDNDIRSEMLDAYARVDKAINKLSFKGVKNLLDYIDKGESAKKKLENF